MFHVSRGSYLSPSIVAFVLLSQLGDCADLGGCATQAAEEIQEMTASQHKLAADQGDAEAQFTYANSLVMVNRHLARHYYRLAAEQGNARAQCAYANCLVMVDLPLAEYYYKLAADQGNAEAQLAYADCFSGKFDSGEDLPLAAHYYMLAAEQGNARAQYAYAACLAEGKGVPIDLCLAADYYKRAADNGDTDAQIMYAQYLENGIGVDKNLFTAAHYRKLAEDQMQADARYEFTDQEDDEFTDQEDDACHELTNHDYASIKFAADRGDAGAQYRYATLLLKGPRSMRDNYMAAHYFSRAADQNHAAAQFHFANMLSSGILGERNYTLAASLYKCAADQGHAKAQFCYADLLFWGKGVALDYVEAAKYYLLAAHKGHAAAQYMYSLMSINGCGTPIDLRSGMYYLECAVKQRDAKAQHLHALTLLTRNTQRALSSLKCAADQGYALAQYDYASLLINGWGNIANDEEMAVIYYTQAASQGDEEAHKRLRELNAFSCPAELKLSKKDRDALVEQNRHMRTMIKRAVDSITSCLNKTQAKDREGTERFYVPCNSPREAMTYWKYAKNLLNVTTSDHLSYALSNDTTLKAQYVQYMYGLHMLKAMNNRDKAAHFFELSAAQGYAPAQYAYAMLVNNPSIAARNFGCAAKQGYVPAQYKYGVCLLEGKEVEKDSAQAAHYFKLAADHGIAMAQLHFALCAWNGEGMAQDLETAVRYFKLAADQGVATAQLNFALCAWSGDVIAKDLELAAHYFKLAVAQGLAPAQNSYALFLSVTNPKMAEHYFQLAAEQGHVSAQCNQATLEAISGRTEWAADIFSQLDIQAARHNLAVNQFQGTEETAKDGDAAFLQFKSEEGMPKSILARLGFDLSIHNFWFDMSDTREQLACEEDLADTTDTHDIAEDLCNQLRSTVKQYSASEYFMQHIMSDVAENNHMSKESYATRENRAALNDLGMCLATGNGIDRDLERAAQYFKLAAEQGDAEGLHNHGLCLMHGIGGPADVVAGGHYIAQAAEQGVLRSQCELGKLLFQGKGMPVDKTMAFENFSRAAERGDAEARHNEAMCWLTGQGVPNKDRAHAMYLLACAAEQGCAEAQYNLGILYLDNKSKTYDLDLAECYLARAAEQGHTTAQCAYGMLLRERDEFIAAMYYLKLAAQAGNQDAERALALMFYEAGNKEEALKLFYKRAKQEDKQLEYSAGDMCLQNETFKLAR
jgi:TPR repeat protein